MDTPKPASAVKTLTFSIQPAYTDFMLSRQAMRVSPATIQFYKYTAGFFVAWLKTQGIEYPHEVTAHHVRAYLAELIARELSDWKLHDHARAIRTLLKFWHSENYMTAPVIFDMPKIEKKRLPVLTADEVTIVLHACKSPNKKPTV